MPCRYPPPCGRWQGLPRQGECLEGSYQLKTCNFSGWLTYPEFLRPEVSKHAAKQGIFRSHAEFCCFPNFSNKHATNVYKCSFAMTCPFELLLSMTKAELEERCSSKKVASGWLNFRSRPGHQIQPESHDSYCITRQGIANLSFALSNQLLEPQ